MRHNIPERIEYRPTRLALGVVAAAVAVFVILGVISLTVSDSHWVTASLFGFSLIGVFGLVELAGRRVTLTPDGLELVSNLRTRFVPRSEIASVTWAKGEGVSLKLVAGTWLHLPEVGPGSQAMVNSVRAWLNRTTPTSG
jgi:Bacterial PH domain